MRLKLTIILLTIMALGTALMAQKRPADKKPADQKKAEQPADEKKGVEPADQKKADEPKDDKKAEPVTDKKADVKPVQPIQISVLAYIEWSAVWGHNSAAYDRIPKFAYNPSSALEKNNDTFAVKRVYIDFKKSFGDIFSARITTDVDATITTGSRNNFAGTAITQGSTATNGNHLFLKFAYLEAKKDFGPVNIGLQFGKIGTPASGHIDKISDYRWIYNNYLEQAGAMLDNQRFDNAADFGILLNIGVMKYLTTSWSLTNGEGFTADEVIGDKAITGLVSVTPIKGLYINGYFRWEITAKYDYTGLKTQRYYGGYGVAWSSDLVKVGVNHIMPYATTVGVASKFNAGYLLGATEIYVGPRQTRRYQLVDAWLNANLGAVVPTVPLILTGRFVYGFKDKTYQRAISDPDLGKSKTSYLYALGIGWKFSGNFRILLGGEWQTYSVKKNAILRSPAAFGGVESNTTGTDTLRTTALYGSNFYVGSSNPRDTKRVYIKTEVSF